jgi:hypothetical protein
MYHILWMADVVDRFWCTFFSTGRSVFLLHETITGKRSFSTVPVF